MSAETSSPIYYDPFDAEIDREVHPSGEDARRGGDPSTGTSATLSNIAHSGFSLLSSAGLLDTARSLDPRRVRSFLDGR